MSNPLFDKYEEIYGKKEKPKPQNTHITPNKKLTSYDPHSIEDSFLQIAEKVKNKDVKVTSVTLNRDSVGLFTTGLTTITFEVQVYDTP